MILTTLHSGGKFGSKACETSGGLHGVGISVVNALAAELVVEVARGRQLHVQRYVRGVPQGPLAAAGAAPNHRGTTVSFCPDPEIFGAGARFQPELLHRMARSKAYLFRGVEIRWRCDPALLEAGATVPAEETFHFPAGLAVPQGPAPGPGAGRGGLCRRGAAGGRGARRMGRGLAARRGDLCRLVLQRDAALTYPRRRACAALSRRSRPCRAQRPAAPGAVRAEDVMGSACIAALLFIRQHPGSRAGRGQLRLAKATQPDRGGGMTASALA
ncbi:MAG: hypothetical protein U1E17_05145 [Geminicoccaceae bacterium]